MTRDLIKMTCALTASPELCLQRGLNSRPLVYKTSALPLSYRGCVSSMAVTYFIHHLHMLAVFAISQHTILPP